jgi:asparagine synthase (glutamine-hydrolysing)
LFGGYPTYLGAGLAAKLAVLPRWSRRLLRRTIEALPPTDKKMTLSFLLKRFVSGMDLDGLARHQCWISNIAPPLLQRLTGEGIQFVPPKTNGGCLLDELQQWDLENTLAEGLLTKADRSSMSSSLELRAPFLDEGVLEFTQSLPPRNRVRGFQTKVFLKRYALRYLPKNIVYRRKRGLSVPVAAWLRGPLRSWAETVLSNGRLERVGIRTTAAQELLAEHLANRADHARALWALIVLSEWLDWASEAAACGETGRPKQNPAARTQAESPKSKAFHPAPASYDEQPVFPRLKPSGGGISANPFDR